MRRFQLNITKSPVRILFQRGKANVNYLPKLQSISESAKDEIRGEGYLGKNLTYIPFASCGREIGYKQRGLGAHLNLDFVSIKDFHIFGLCRKNVFFGVELNSSGDGLVIILW